MIERSSLNKVLGRYLKQKRIEAGFTQVDVANRLGYSTAQFISNFERGLCAPPIKNLRVLIKLYGLDPEEVLGLIMDEQESSLRKALLTGTKRRRKSRALSYIS